MNDEALALIYEVERLLLMGKPLDLILDGMKAGDPGDSSAKPPRPPRDPVPERDIREAHAEVLRRWCEDAATTDLNFARQLRTLRHLYDKSYKLNDFKTCVGIQVRIEALQAKHRPKDPGQAAAEPLQVAPGTPKPKARKLHPKQEAFAREYAIDHNATQAAIRAGYSEKTAGQIGFALLKIIEVRQLVDAYDAEAEARAEVSRDWILRGLKLEAKSAETAGPRVRAFELLGKEVGMFRDRVELTGKDGAPLTPVEEADLSNLSIEELRQLRDLKAKTKPAHAPAK